MLAGPPTTERTGTVDANFGHTRLSVAEWSLAPPGANRREEIPMGKTGRKRRARRKNKANHGKRPNA